MHHVMATVVLLISLFLFSSSTSFAQGDRVFSYVAACKEENAVGKDRYRLCETYIRKLPPEQSESLYFLQERVKDLIAGAGADADWALGRFVLATWAVVTLAALTIVASFLNPEKFPVAPRLGTLLMSLALLLLALTSSFGYSRQYAATTGFRLQLIALRDEIDVEFVSRMNRMELLKTLNPAEQKTERDKNEKMIGSYLSRYRSITDSFSEDYTSSFGAIKLPSLFGT